MQSAGCCLGIKHDPRLLQNPRLDAFVMHSKQFERTHGVMFFCSGAGLVALYLGDDPDGYL